MATELVSVIIPAFNAADTLEETLLSARAQTHRDLEIIVVDDGSTDATPDVALLQASVDPRVRVLRQAHAGHCVARNRGIAEARGDLIAPLDADDLWHPSKIEKQLRALQEGGERVGLVYCWFALLDDRNRIRSTGHRPTDSGDVLEACCRRNLVGNGSGALMRKAAIQGCGGYDTTLQGCEDLKLYAGIAERYRFAVVPELLTGYRESRRNVTSDVRLMRASLDRVIAELLERHPQHAAGLEEMRLSVYGWLFRRAVAARNPGGMVELLRGVAAIDRGQALQLLLSVPKVAVMRQWYATGRPLVRGLLGRPGGFSVPRFPEGAYP
jgi:glycosyltransferase involved in cell wall biosynthesis